MTALELSIMSNATMLTPPLQQALQLFESQHRIPVQVELLPWDTGRSQLVDFALFETGPDVSETGTTWLSSFIAMNTLHQFTEREVNALGGSSTFLPAAWESAITLRGQIWSIPWLTDTRIICYRRDLLEKAGVDEDSAFQSAAQMKQTFERLRASGVTLPWTMPTDRSSITLHNVAPWVWQAGGHFISEDGRSTHFNEPEARAGIRAYFENYFPYLAPAARHLNASQSGILFQNGEAAATISGYWLLHVMQQGEATPEVTENVGVAVPPGVPFVGGSNLVIWKYSHRRSAAFELVKHLTSREVQTNHLRQAGLLPVRIDVLNAPPYTTEPFYQVIDRILKSGRTFRANYLWGLVEDNLVTAINQLWEKLFADPDLNLEKAIADELEPLAQKLDRTLSGQRR
jgi:multiple sugar transport system substrate-binding protein